MTELSEYEQKIMNEWLNKTPDVTYEAYEEKLKSLVKYHPYVTIDGYEPKVPISFLHTKKFIAIGVCSAFLMGAIAYFFIFTHQGIPQFLQLLKTMGI